MSGKKHKVKGDKYERDLARIFTARLGLPVERAPLSGGGAIGIFVGGADLIGTPGLHVEAKRVERAAWPEWLRQAEASIAKTRAPELPVVINRTNGMKDEDSYCMVRLSHFLDLYRAWLFFNGYIGSSDEND